MIFISFRFSFYIVSYNLTLTLRFSCLYFRMNICQSVVSDSRLVFEKDKILANYNFIGGSGYRLKFAKNDILEHYNKFKNCYDALIYKVVLGINDLTSISTKGGIKQLIPKDPPFIKNYLLDIMDLAHNHTKLYLSFCRIPSACLGCFINSKNRYLGHICTNTTYQATLTSNVASANTLIDNFNILWPWIDISSNKNFGDRINCNVTYRPRVNRSVRNYLRSRGRHIPMYVKTRSNYNRLKDGLHFTRQWRLNSANNLVESMKKEHNTFQDLMSPRPSSKRSVPIHSRLGLPDKISKTSKKRSNFGKLNSNRWH